MGSQLKVLHNTIVIAKSVEYCYFYFMPSQQVNVCNVLQCDVCTFTCSSLCALFTLTCS